MSASFPTYQPRLLYIDLFCGAGGVTTGVSRVPGVQVVVCVNHDATANTHPSSHSAKDAGAKTFLDHYKNVRSNSYKILSKTAPLDKLLNIKKLS